MARRNLYIVLNVPTDATPEVIRSAYRRLAKAYHPDRVGPGGAAQFEEISHAYQVLSDPQLRSAHNHELHLTAPVPNPISEPLGHGYPPAAEPMVAEPITIRDSLRTSHPSLEDEFVAWISRYVTQRGVPNGAYIQPVNLEIILSPEEAASGAMLPIELPVAEICPMCRGIGRHWFSWCSHCEGTGTFENRRVARLRIPAGMRDNTLWEVPLPDAGMQLRVRVRVDANEGWL